MALRWETVYSEEGPKEMFIEGLHGPIIQITTEYFTNPYETNNSSVCDIHYDA